MAVLSAPIRPVSLVSPMLVASVVAAVRSAATWLSIGVAPGEPGGVVLSCTTSQEMRYGIW